MVLKLLKEQKNTVNLVFDNITGRKKSLAGVSQEEMAASSQRQNREEEETGGVWRCPDRNLPGRKQVRSEWIPSADSSQYHGHALADRAGNS